MRRRYALAAMICGTLMLLTVACGDDDDDASATPGASAAVSSPVPTAPGNPTPQATAAAATDPCTLRTALDGRALVAGESFAIDGPVRWQICVGGAAAGSSEKFLFRSNDGGASWTLISRTTLGEPPAEAGVGELPNQGAVQVLYFQDALKGWMGLGSPGENLYRSTDGGVSWTSAGVPPPAVPVTAISFSDALAGTFETPDGPWTTTDGGDTWTETP